MTTNWISYPPRTLFGTAVLFLLTFLSFNGQSVSALDVRVDKDEAQLQKPTGCEENPEDYFCMSPDIIGGGPVKCGLLAFLKGPYRKQICEAPATCDGYGSAADVCFESCEPYKKYKFYKNQFTCKFLSLQEPEKKEKHCKNNDNISGGRVCFMACDTCPNDEEDPLVAVAVDVLGDCASPLGSYDCDNDRNEALAWFYDVNSHSDDMTDFQALKERLVVAILYTSFGSPDALSDWMAKNDHCGWDGLTCSANGYLTRLDLDNKLLTGTIASEVEGLSSLQYMYLFQNSLTGSLPSQIANLSALESIYLYTNDLTGSLPSQFGELTNLQTIGLAHNSLTGSLPSQIANLSNVYAIDLSQNSLTGLIPSELGSMNALKYLYLYGNDIIGPVPTKVAQFCSSTATYCNLGLTY